MNKILKNRTIVAVAGISIFGAIAYFSQPQFRLSSDEAIVEFKAFTAKSKLWLASKDNNAPEKLIAFNDSQVLKKGLYQYRLQLDGTRKKEGEIAVLESGTILMK